MDKALAVSAILHPELARRWEEKDVVFLWDREESSLIWGNHMALLLWGDKNRAIPLCDNQPSIPRTLLRQLQNVTKQTLSTDCRIERFRFYVHKHDINLFCKCTSFLLDGKRLLLAESLNQISLPSLHDFPLTNPQDHARYLLSAFQGENLLALSTKDHQVLSACGKAQELLRNVAKANALSESELLDRILKTEEEVPLQGGHFPTSISESENLQYLRIRKQLIPVCQDKEQILVLHLQPEPENPALAHHQEKICPIEISTKNLENTGKNRHVAVSDTQDWESTAPLKNSQSSSNTKKRNKGEKMDTPSDQLIESTGNIFPFTGVASRIHPGSPRMGDHERDAFREIARALGARIEGETEPPAAPTAVQDLPSESHIREVLRLLDRVSDAILVYRGENPLYANRSFLEMLGSESLADLSQQIPLSEILTQITGKAVTKDPKSSVPQSLTNGSLRLQSIYWKGEKAFLLSLSRTLQTPHSSTSPVPTSDIHDSTHTHPPASEPVYNACEDDALSQERSALFSMLSLAADGLIIADKKGRTLNIDEGALRLLGLKEKVTSEQALHTFFPPSVHSVILECLASVEADPKPSPQEVERRITLLREDGETVILYLRPGIIKLRNTEYFCIVLQDGARAAAHEADLIQARYAAEAANAQKSAFLARISHEIRTPLNAIIGFSEIMSEEGFRGIKNERYCEYIRDIRSSGKHLLCLVNDLLDLSKVEAGKLELDLAKVDLNEIARHSIDILQPEATRKRTILRQNLASSLPSIVADRRSLHQVLLNLLSNAVKFNRPGGQVLISTGVTKQQEVCIQVRDTGIGMTPRQLELALETFRQAHDAEANQNLIGTGLGLPLAKALTEANHAKFSLSSTPGCGTLVEILFPPIQERAS